VSHPLEDRDLVDLAPAAHGWAVSHEQALCMVGSRRVAWFGLTGTQLPASDVIYEAAGLSE
jgi:hypothetical protein